MKTSSDDAEGYPDRRREAGWSHPALDDARCRLYGTRGPFLFLIHGWCCNPGFWSRQIDGLAQDFRIVTFDFDTSFGDDTGTVIERMAEMVVVAADALEVQSLVLVGHSMGGPVAVEAAVRLGGRCALMIGVDTFTDAAFYRRLVPAERERRLGAFRVDFEGTMTTMVHRITSDRVAGLADWIAASMTAQDLSVALARLEALFDWDIEARWPLLACPVETINSAVLSEGAELLALPGLSVHLMETVGHFPMLEEAEGFNALARSILERHLPTAGTDHLS